MFEAGGRGGFRSAGDGWRAVIDDFDGGISDGGYRIEGGGG